MLISMAGGLIPAGHARPLLPPRSALLGLFNTAACARQRQGHSLLSSLPRALLLDAIAMAVFLCCFMVLLAVASCSAEAAAGATAGGERCVRQGKAAYAPSLSPLPQGTCCRAVAVTDRRQPPDFFRPREWISVPFLLRHGSERFLRFLVGW